MTDQSIKLQQLAEEKAKNQRDYNAKKEDLRRKNEEFKFKKIHDTGKLIFDSTSKAAGTAIGMLAANDPSWYNQVPELSELAGKVSFSVPSGLSLPSYDSMLNAGGGESRPNPAPSCNPGIMTFEFIPTIGSQDDLTVNPIMASGQNIFSKIREAISPALPYEAMDVVKLALLLDSAAYIACYAARTYSFMGQTSHTNKYKVFGYLKASMPYATDAQLDEFIQEANDFRLAINKFIQQISFVKIPADFRVITRHSWMCSNVFSDSPEKDSNVYMFIPSLYYQYNLARGSLDPVSLSDEPLTSVATWRKLFNNIVNTFYNFTDVARISGDCVKTYGIDKCFSFAGLSVEPTTMVEPIYSLEVLSQICNATVGAYAIEQPTYNTVQSACIWEKNSEVTSTSFQYGRLYQSVYPGNQDRVELGVVTRSGGPYTHYLRMYKDNVTADDVIVATRLMFHAGANVGTQNGVSIRTIPVCGSEVILAATIYMFDTPNAKYPTKKNLQGDFSDGYEILANAFSKPTQLFQTFRNILNDVCISTSYLKAFEWAPLLRRKVTVSNPDNPTEDYTLQYTALSDYDMHSIANIPTDALNNMHYAAVVSLFAGESFKKNGGKNNRIK